MAAHIARSALSKKMPLIVILGATGCGKSKLSIEIAQRFKGEIINSDAMQVYQGLDVITNKVTPEERRLVRHHLLDFLNPGQRCTVIDFRNRALPLISELKKQGKMPIVVGGTNYYIEALIWHVLLGPEPKVDANAPLLYEECQDLVNEEDNTCTSETLHQRLKELDADSADKLHPRDRRRILRALQVYEQTGRLYSEVIREQRSVSGGNALGGPLRDANTCILWLQCDQSVLDQRLDARVDEMASQGLVAELIDFHKRYNEMRLKDKELPDYTQGIFQSIGFKEFHPFLMMSQEEQSTPEGQKLLKEGFDELKVVTRRYARKQLKWIRNRFLRRPDRQIPPIFGLDATDVHRWDEEVLSKASTIVQSFMDDVVCPYSPIPQEAPIQGPLTSVHCDVCNKTLVGTIHIKGHFSSRRHKKQVASAAARLKYQKDSSSLPKE